jgi:hypothetical protein
MFKTAKRWMAGGALSAALVGLLATAPAVLADTNLGEMRSWDGARKLCLDDAGYPGSQSKRPGNLMQQWRCNGTANQLWSAHLMGTTSGVTVWEIRNRWSGMCLDARNNRLADGTLIQQWPCTGKRNQLWAFDFESWALASTFNSLPEVLDVQNRSTSSGARIQLWHFIPGTDGFAEPNQSWFCTAPSTACAI